MSGGHCAVALDREALAHRILDLLPEGAAAAVAVTATATSTRCRLSLSLLGGQL